MQEEGTKQNSIMPFGEVLPYAEIQVEGQFKGEGSLPPFRGATLRGGFGYHLKRTVCHRKQGTCQDCIVRTTCAYSCIFEGVPPDERQIMRLYPYVPQPFTFLVNGEEPTWIERGAPFLFGMRLFGRALDLFPYIVYSLIQMGQEGLGKDRIPFRITRIIQPAFQSEIYRQEENCIRKVQKEVIPNSVSSGERVQVDFLTPVRLRVHGQEPSSLRFEDLIRAVIRRFSILTHFYGTPYEENGFDLSALCAVRTVFEQIRTVEFRRFSGRQKRSVEMSGLLGTLVFEGELEPFLPWLAVAQVIGVGKATSFGFGRIHITSIQEDKNDAE